MRKIMGGVVVVVGAVLMFTAFLFTLGLPLVVLGLVLFFWPAMPKQ